MTHYRLYFMNPRSGHIDRAQDLDAPDDQAALRLASTYDGIHPLELWCNSRKVYRIERPSSGVIVRFGTAQAAHEKRTGA
ncbi:hypothetical protein [Sphingomonas crusticola]|uniref:hypothetical protein n=1 Tax=Sphingomonas crusticola TaxID=1697973 RepID=UPI000E2782E4|nr:hypothetical protein [Sphingomonas crusticola]